MTTLSVAEVSKRFGHLAAVDRVSFELGEHELLALVGPSGCGKSTLLRMIAGLQPVDSGTIVLGGAIVDDGVTCEPPERRRVGLVFQEHALFPHLSVEKNIGFGVRDDRSNIASRVADMLALVGLDGYGRRYPHELSGGERQRVALARALAPRPAMLLLDEPFASLDPNLRSRVRDDVVAALRTTGTPAVFVTHDQNEALAIGDRVAVMHAGEIVQLDHPEVVFHQPSSRFVAAFMGEASFLPLDVAERELAGITLPLEHPRDATIMVRPDDIGFSVADTGTASVISAEFRGSSWAYMLQLPSGTLVRATRSHLDHVAVGALVEAHVRPGHEPVIIPAGDRRADAAEASVTAASSAGSALGPPDG